MSIFYSTLSLNFMKEINKLMFHERDACCFNVPKQLILNVNFSWIVSNDIVDIQGTTTLLERWQTMYMQKF